MVQPHFYFMVPILFSLSKKRKNYWISFWFAELLTTVENITSLNSSLTFKNSLQVHFVYHLVWWSKHNILLCWLLYLAENRISSSFLFTCFFRFFFSDGRLQIFLSKKSAICFLVQNIPITEKNYITAKIMNNSFLHRMKRFRWKW